MKFFWNQESSAPVAPADREIGGGPATQACPSLSKALKKLFREEGASPRVLDLGPFSGESAVYLARLGARVTVEEFNHLPFNRAPEDDDDVPAPVLKIDAPDGAFDLILAWEHFDYLPRNELDRWGAELRRVLADGGWLLFFARNPKLGNSEAEVEAPQRFRITGDDSLTVTETGWEGRLRYAHPTRLLETAVSPMKVNGIHLQRNQTREFLIQKPVSH